MADSDRIERDASGYGYVIRHGDGSVSRLEPGVSPGLYTLRSPDGSRSSVYPSGDSDFTVRGPGGSTQHWHGTTSSGGYVVRQPGGFDVGRLAGVLDNGKAQAAAPPTSFPSYGEGYDYGWSAPRQVGAADRARQRVELAAPLKTLQLAAPFAAYVAAVHYFRPHIGLHPPRWGGPSWIFDQRWLDLGGPLAVLGLLVVAVVVLAVTVARHSQSAKQVYLTGAAFGLAYAAAAAAAEGIAILGYQILATGAPVGYWKAGAWLSFFVGVPAVLAAAGIAIFGVATALLCVGRAVRG